MAVLFAAVLTWCSVTYFNSLPAPQPHSQLGMVVVDLERLGYRLRYEDLQAAGMFVESGCRKCDLSAGGGALLLNDFKDSRFMGVLVREGHVLWLSFFGEDIPGGQQYLDQSLQRLRARFTGNGDAFRLVARGFGEKTSEWKDP